MSTSWSDIVRGYSLPTLTVVPTPPPQVIFHPFCADCGNEADVCQRCNKLAVYESGLCGHCFSSNMDSEWMCEGYCRASDEAEKIPFKCGPCRLANPWSWFADKEIVAYRYEKTCREDPITPRSVIRVPTYRLRGLVYPYSYERAMEAKAAYEKELAFSGDQKEAFRIYNSFYTNMMPRKLLKEGFVSLEEFSQGQPVSGAQFFAAICASKV